MSKLTCELEIGILHFEPLKNIDIPFWKWGIFSLDKPFIIGKQML
jgi:hypothetical protein